MKKNNQPTLINFSVQLKARQTKLCLESTGLKLERTNSINPLFQFCRIQNKSGLKKLNYLQVKILHPIKLVDLISPL